MGFTFIAAGRPDFGRAFRWRSRRPSVTDSFDRESSNSVEQTFTVVVVSFMVAPADVAREHSLLSSKMLARREELMVMKSTKSPT